MRADYSTSQQTDYSWHLKPVWQLNETGGEVADVAEREDQESFHDRWDRKESHVFEDEGKGYTEYQADSNGYDTQEQELAQDFKRRIPVEAWALKRLNCIE